MCVSVGVWKCVPVRKDGRGQRALLPFKGSVPESVFSDSIFSAARLDKS